MNLLLSTARGLLFGVAGTAALVTSSCSPQDHWQSFDASGLKVEIPAAPKDLNVTIPAEIASVTDTFKIWQSIGSDCDVTISYSAYKQAPDLRLAFDGNVSGMKATFPDFTALEASSQLGGRQAIEGHTTFTAGGQRHEGYMIAIVDGVRLWQVQIVPIGTGSASVERTRASLKFE